MRRVLASAWADDQQCITRISEKQKYACPRPTARATPVVLGPAVARSRGPLIVHSRLKGFRIKDAAELRRLLRDRMNPLLPRFLDAPVSESGDCAAPSSPRAAKAGSPSSSPSRTLAPSLLTPLPKSVRAQDCAPATKSAPVGLCTPAITSASLVAPAAPARPAALYRTLRPPSGASFAGSAAAGLLSAAAGAGRGAGLCSTAAGSLSFAMVDSKGSSTPPSPPTRRALAFAASKHASAPPRPEGMPCGAASATLVEKKSPQQTGSTVSTAQKTTKRRRLQFEDIVVTSQPVDSADDSPRSAHRSAVAVGDARLETVRRAHRLMIVLGKRSPERGVAGPLLRPDAALGAKLYPAHPPTVVVDPLPTKHNVEIVNRSLIPLNSATAREQLPRGIELYAPPPPSPVVRLVPFEDDVEIVSVVEGRCGRDRKRRRLEAPISAPSSLPSKPQGAPPASASLASVAAPSVALDADEDTVEVVAATVSLVCPLTMCRMTAPCRGRLCTHAQCFDRETFLLNAKSSALDVTDTGTKSRWVCPVCDRALTEADLVDHLPTKDILRIAPPHLSEINVRADGTLSL